MGLELRKGESKWWYGRVVVNGRKLTKNLGVEVRGSPPPKLSELGDMAFERSRAKAMAAFESWQTEMKRRTTAEELVQTIHEIRTGARVSSIPLGEIGTRWKALPRRRPLAERYLAQAEGWIDRFTRVRYQAATGDAKSRILADFIALTGYHRKYAIDLLNRRTPEVEHTRSRKRMPLYDDAARQALIVLWEASDRICGKRLKPLLPMLVNSLERHGHLRLDEGILAKILSMSAATIDRLLRAPKAVTRDKKRRHIVPEIRRRVPVRTFADWDEPSPGCMEMDLVSHCGESNRGSFVHSLVLTDIASGWTECTPVVARDRSLVVAALDKVRTTLPFALRALDIDNGSEFLNETMLNYCVNAGIELTRSRPYRKNDQAWIEQKNGAVVRRMIGYRRFEGIAAAQALGALYAVSRFFVNFFQPSFKLAEKSREGAVVTKRYHTPQTPCDRLLAHDEIGEPMKARLREVAEALDPLHLLEEIRVLQAHLVNLDADSPRVKMASAQRNLGSFLATLASAWHAGEVRPTHARETSPPRFLRRIEIVTIPADPKPTVITVVEARSDPQLKRRPDNVAPLRRVQVLRQPRFRLLGDFPSRDDVYVIQ